ncbi:MAG: DUF4860 domain-containing protein [Candidatus Choladocola sp.]|nr:DUF4860 domain-containing protein [Candidatus Choladocola sp.]
MNRKRHQADSLFTFLLLLIFALFTLVLAGTGGAVYKNGVTHLNENYTSRTAIAYVSEKVRQHDSSNDVFLTSVEDLPALGLRDAFDGETFLTYIYFYEGCLRELFVREDTVPTASSGTRIVDLSSFTVENPGTTEPADAGSLFRVTAVSPEGDALSLFIHLSCS